MPTERELHPTFDPLEPAHNPVTEGPAPASEQPVTLYAFPDGTTRKQQIDLLLNRIVKDSTSNEIRSMAFTLLHGQGGDKVSIVKYDDEPVEESPASVPVERQTLEAEQK